MYEGRIEIELYSRIENKLQATCESELINDKSANKYLKGFPQVLKPPDVAYELDSALRISRVYGHSSKTVSLPDVSRCALRKDPRTIQHGVPCSTRS
jgi:hypothetical protein